MTASGELVEVIDEHGAVERVATRAEMRARNLRHRMVGVVVITSGREVVAHRRADWKDLWPGRWDVSFGGIPAVGESWRAAACRELAEEAGIVTDPDALREIGRGSYADDEVSACSRIYVVQHDGPFRPVDGEVAELALVPLVGLGSWTDEQTMCPDSVAAVLPLLFRLAQGEPLPPPPHAGE